MGLRCDLQYAIRNWQWHRGVERLIKRNLQLQSRGCISNKLHSECDGKRRRKRERDRERVNKTAGERWKC